MRLGTFRLGENRLGEDDELEARDFGAEHAFLGDNILGERYLGQGSTPVGRLGGRRPDRPATYPVEEQTDLVGAISPEGPQESRERLNQHLKKPFKLTDATPDEERYSTWDGILDTFASEFERLEYARDEASLARHVDFAQGGTLDKIGYFVDTPRRQNEPDRLYRARIKMELRTVTAGGTIADLKDAAGSILDSPPEDIRITEDFPDFPAELELGVQRSDLDEVQIEIGEFVDIITRTKAAGVEIFGLVLGGFTHRSLTAFENDQNDPDLGYGQLDAAGDIDPDVGGEYASLFAPGGEPRITL